MFSLFNSKKDDLVLKVDGLNCKNCEMKVSKIVAGIPGIKDFEASSKSKTLRLRFEAEAPKVETLTSALEEAGYKSEILQ